MAKQVGLIKLDGTIQDITFFKTKDGFMAKEATSLSAEKMKDNPNFDRTRENGLEFGRAATAGKNIRAAFRPVLKLAKDSRVVSRLVKQLMKVIKSDSVNVRGYRSVTDGDLSLLTNFNFNERSVISERLFAPYSFTIDRVAGTLSIRIPAFVPVDNVEAPQGATHFKIMSMGAQVDFDRQLSVVDEQDSAILPINGTATGALNLVNTVTADSTDPLLLVFGIQYYQLVNGVEYPLKDESFNSLSLIGIDAV